MVVDASHLKVIVMVWAMAHHAGYRTRIDWDQAHCARDVGILTPIGQYISNYPN